MPEDSVETSAEHFEAFQRAAKAWQERLELHEWRIYFNHGCPEDFYSQVHYRTGSRIATIGFARKWDALRPLTEEEIVLLARHEVCHLLTADLQAVAKERYASEQQIDDAEEILVRRIEHTIGPVP